MPTSILATVTILQFAEGHSDREAVKQVCARIDWKYLLGLELTYSGFNFSALSRFRERLVKNNAADRLFEGPLERMKEMGLVNSRGRQRTDATNVLAQIRTLNRLELLGETMRQALEEAAKITPEWLRKWVPTEWFDRYGTRIENAKLPKDKTKRDALAQTIGQDGYQLLLAVAQPDAPPELYDALTIQILRMVWMQQFYGPGLSAELRKTEDLPPAHYMINSPYDLDAHFSRKRKITWTGYKVHLSESCDEELPHLLTHVETTPATEPDSITLPTIHEALESKGLSPAEHLVDAGYVNIDNLADSRSEKIDLVGPVRPDSSWQVREKSGYDISHFVIEWNAQYVTCPQGKKSTVWSLSTNNNGDQSITVRFAKPDCLSCCARKLCTRSKTHEPRGLRLQPSQLLHDSLQEARSYQLTEEFHDRYRPRAGIEGTISQATRSYELRRTRYIGQTKTALQHFATATAINLSRLYNWWQELKLAPTRTTAFLELKPLAT